MRFDPRAIWLSILFGTPLLGICLYLRRSISSLLPSILLSILFIWFHRDPPRDIAENGVVSPVDGTVKSIDRSNDRVKISIYLGLSDVHIVRSPVDGIITNMYRSGEGNYPALLDISEKNNSLVYEYEKGIEVAIMTGFIARRLKSKVDAGGVCRGDRIGIISFGSRSTVSFSSNRYELKVSEGDKITAGETNIAK